MSFFTQQITTGLDLSDRKLRLVRLHPHYRNVTLLAFAELDLPAGIIQDGTVLQPESFVAALKELPKRAIGSHWHAKNVHVGLPEQLSFVTAMAVDATDKEAAEHSIIRSVPMTSSEMYYDTLLSRSSKLMSLAAARKDVVDRLLQYFDAANYDVVGLHVESEAIAHAVLPWPLAKAPTTMLVDIGLARTTLALWGHGAIHFTVSYPSVLQNGSLQDAQLAGALQQSKNYILDHFQRVGDVAQYVICGSGASIQGIDQWLQQVVQLPVQISNPLLHVKTNHLSQKLPNPTSFATAIGLALTD